MKKITSLLGVFVILTSCNTSIDKQENENSNDLTTTPETNIETTCKYNPDNNISDSLIMMCDEVMEKVDNFNSSKWDYNLKKWQGKSFQISDTEISIINDWSIILEYGIATDGLEAAAINLTIHLENPEDAVNYEKGQKVNIEGVILDPYTNPRQDYGSGWKFYEIYTSCLYIVE